MSAVFLASADVADIIRKMRAEHAAELAAKDAEITRLLTAIREALDFQAVLPAIATRPREILTRALDDDR